MVSIQIAFKDFFIIAMNNAVSAKIWFLRLLRNPILLVFSKKEDMVLLAMPFNHLW